MMERAGMEEGSTMQGENPHRPTVNPWFGTVHPVAADGTTTSTLMGGDAVAEAWAGEDAPVTAYGTGCTRSSDADGYAYDIIPSCATKREAARWALGERTHGRGNWQLGQPLAVMVRHLLAHAQSYLAALEDGRALDESARDDHLAAIRCNAAMLMWYEERHPELFAPGEWPKPIR